MQDMQRLNYGRISRDEAVQELAGKAEGTFLVRMSQTDAETYTLSVVQDAQVRARGGSGAVPQPASRLHGPARASHSPRGVGPNCAAYASASSRDIAGVVARTGMAERALAGDSAYRRSARVHVMR